MRATIKGNGEKKKVYTRDATFNEICSLIITLGERRRQIREYIAVDVL